MRKPSRGRCPISSAGLSHAARILFLDDNRTRHALVQSKYPDAECVTTSRECIARLQHGFYNLVALDHDLQDGDTGMAVILWLVEHRPPLEWLVLHSTNLLAGLRMLAAAQGAGYQALYLPFRADPGGPFHL